jgi:hypothetical protein
MTPHDKEIDLNVRAAIVFGRKQRMPFQDISNQINVKRNSAGVIANRAFFHSNKNDEYPFHTRNIQSQYKSGRSERLTTRQKQKIFKHATLNKKNRLKRWVTIAAECHINASRSYIKKVFKEAGYGRYTPKQKSQLTDYMKETRFKWCEARLGWTFGEYRKRWSDWQLIVFTDETPVSCGSQDRKQQVIRLKGDEEAWLKVCTKKVFKHGFTYFFQGSIAWNWKGLGIFISTENPIEREAAKTKFLKEI